QLMRPSVAGPAQIGRVLMRSGVGLWSLHNDRGDLDAAARHPVTCGQLDPDLVHHLEATTTGDFTEPGLELVLKRGLIGHELVEIPWVEADPEVIGDEVAADRDNWPLDHRSFKLLSDFGGLHRAAEEPADAAFHHPFHPLLEPIEDVH
ncbi:MAG: hypothetical protein M3457_12310, partial [Chloroflexota bacterium]|nr:hypothetical protein [Chloroflexota bacterium]